MFSCIRFVQPKGMLQPPRSTYLKSATTFAACWGCHVHECAVRARSCCHTPCQQPKICEIKKQSMLPQHSFTIRFVRIIPVYPLVLQHINGHTQPGSRVQPLQRFLPTPPFLANEDHGRLDKACPLEGNARKSLLRSYIYILSSYKYVAQGNHATLLILQAPPHPLTQPTSRQTMAGFDRVEH